MRSQEQIVSFCKEAMHAVFGTFTLEVLVPFLEPENAKQFVSPKTDMAEWHQVQLVEESIVNEMAHYIGFAWEKVRMHRGLSAIRSVIKIRAWLWLLEDEELYVFVCKDENFTNYGAPILKAVCEAYKIPIPNDRAILRMVDGNKCRPDCDWGCEDD